MASLLVAFISLCVLLLSKILFKRWFNHLSLYVIIWSGLILLYEMKLLPYSEVIPFVWFIIFACFLSFFLGILSYFVAKKLQKEDGVKEKEIDIALFSDGGKTVKYALILFSIIALYAAIQHWMVLIEKFGSIPAVFLNANTVYLLNTKGGIKGQVPFLSNFGYVAIFFAALYTAYKGRFSFISFLPFLAIIIKELATVGRAGMLLALLQFAFTFFLFRQLLKRDRRKRYKFSKSNALIALFLIVFIFISSASIVRLTRGAKEAYSGSSNQLRKFEENLILSPSLYLYLSSHIGVLNKYFQSEGENTGFGQNTFLTVYHILDKFSILDRPSDYQKGYFIPMWTNTGTYIRELHADFGLLGVFLIPYLFGLFITWLWHKYFEKNSLLILTVLVYLYLIIGFTFLVMITRTSYWSISQVLILTSLPIIELIAKFRQNTKYLT